MSQRDQEGAGSRNAKCEGGSYHLPGSHADGLEVKFSTAHVEQIFETRPQQVDDENVVQTLLSKMVNLRDTGCSMA